MIKISLFLLASQVTAQTLVNLDASYSIVGQLDSLGTSLIFTLFSKNTGWNAIGFGGIGNTMVNAINSESILIKQICMFHGKTRLLFQ